MIAIYEPAYNFINKPPNAVDLFPFKSKLWPLNQALIAASVRREVSFIRLTLIVKYGGRKEARGGINMAGG